MISRYKVKDQIPYIRHLWNRNLKIERHQLGSVDHLADVLEGLIKKRGFVSKQTVCGDQFCRLVLFAV